MPELRFMSIPHIPHVQPGDNLAELLLTALQQANIELQNGDVLAIAQKIVSKAEGRLVNLGTVTPGAQAQIVAGHTGKDSRVVELILQESEEISRMRPGVLIVRHRLGFTSANAGIDRSNVAQSGADETVLLLPEDPDASAARICQHLQEYFQVQLGVVITDSHGRPFRLGTVGVAIGVAGMPALWNRRGELDLYGYALQHTDVAVADEVAAAAGLLMGQAAEGSPAIVVRGLQLPAGDGKATDLIRPKELDLYR
ncbi:MAG: coenzyme F420-0:L-glutamate ligase [Chloroflexi bacterium]|nr:coenzyme F420-0:L-glutamate ligase [Ardenticatenaceae bacterium]MBL1129537.1 coenzyme F420-0:L-glutamate ligase [Chloroflexota bacterium]NOG35619.1 coenzyme F420-0:L-glutamate ligase [Chloroflexota bacterium]GIK58496.1 MAG: F420-0--gamma-glutamyl ligase [Chloroflexota bacterium]